MEGEGGGKRRKEEISATSTEGKGGEKGREGEKGMGVKWVEEKNGGGKRIKEAR